MSALDWDLDIAAVGAQIAGDVRSEVESIAIKLFSGVIGRTPVRSGSLRASWRLSPGSPDPSITKGGSDNAPLPAPSVPTSIPGLPDYPVVYVTNSTPYADDVENGGPRNAPAYMMKLTVDSLQ